VTERARRCPAADGRVLGPRLGGLLAAALAAAAPAAAADPAAGTAAALVGKPLPAPAVSSIATSDCGMVASGSPEATAAGVRILEAGGNAIDAAVAAAFTLGVADLDSSGLGGMAYMVIRLADGRSAAVDGTAPTPAGADPVRLRALPRGDDLAGHAMAAVPTSLAVLELARARYGTRPLAELIEPAIEVAERGYLVSPAQIVWAGFYLEPLLRSGYLRLIAFDDRHLSGRPVDEDAAIGRPGDRRCRPELAATLRLIQRDGPAAFYRGEIAERIEADMIANGGFVRRSDLAALRVREVQPLHATYRGAQVLAFPAPGGGPVVIGALRILESFPAAELAEDSPWRAQLLLEATRIAYADRNTLVAAAWPGTGGLRPQEHGRERARLITPGSPLADEALRGPLPPECAPTGDSTTQVSVVDAWGNAVSLTQTLGRCFGAKVATPGLGFPYNSLLEAFNIDRPQCPGYLQPRQPCPTDMAPTIVVRGDGTLLAALGAPGSARIPAMVVGVISNLVDRGQGLAAAVEAPRVLANGLARDEAIVEITNGRDARIADALEAMGYGALERIVLPPDRRIVLSGGLNAVGWDAAHGQFVGIGDGRRWGAAGGPAAVAELAPAP
jgi:gamma-glutamyltranspeptidase/glutathione hydrolase